MCGATAHTVARAGTDCVDGVCLIVNDNDASVWFGARNETPAPVQLQLQIRQPVNLLASGKLPASIIVAPGETRRVLLLTQRDQRRGWSFDAYRWQWSMGDPSAQHDDTHLYRMPFGGTLPRPLTQGVGGSFSHDEPGSYHAFDFAMPLGTPILAARSGTVVAVADGHTEGGASQEFIWQANSVTILHNDGTFAGYGHLDPGAGVRVGMQVLTGDIIGFSGNTGFSTGPHLHFSVWRASGGKAKTVPIRFWDGDAFGMLPREGQEYGPGCHADGIPCQVGDLPTEERSREVGYVSRADDGTCRCANGSVITTHLPCRMVCPRQ